MSTQPLANRSLGLLGAGNMAEAILRGTLRAGLIAPEKITASDVSPERRMLFSKELGVKAVEGNLEVVKSSDLLVLCVKPQQVDALLAEISPAFDTKKTLLASICAGVTTSRLENGLPAGAKVVRVMPNTPMLSGLGASCLCAGRNAREEDLVAIEALFASSSIVQRVPEERMDAVTGLSGSGPAYLFYLVEAMVDAGIAEGFTRAEATRLASRTCLGAAKMLEDTQLSPEELRRRVTSPNGTTQAAIELLDGRDVKSSLTAAVRRAAERSRELGRGK